jgi:DNA-binding response OmpR family regulator
MGAYGAPVKVIVCDDEPDIRLLYRSAFQAAGTDVAVARDGQECVDLVEDFHPALVVLDLMMPNRNGFSALGELRDRWPGVPVIVVSAYTSPQSMAMARELGAEHCFNKLEFLGQIPVLVSQYESAA